MLTWNSEVALVLFLRAACYRQASVVKEGNLLFVLTSLWDLASNSVPTETH